MPSFLLAEGRPQFSIHEPRVMQTPGVAAEGEYYIFRFLCYNGDKLTKSYWMDQRVSQYTVMKTSHNYLSCDRIILQLDALDLHFDGPDPSTVSLQRMWAPIMGDVDQSISWSVATDCGHPDSARLNSSSSMMSYEWDDSWPDDYWAVKYEKSGTDKRFMVRARFIDSTGKVRYLYLVPWVERTW
jgi:hypothetical protein